MRVTAPALTGVDGILKIIYAFLERFVAKEKGQRNPSETEGALIALDSLNVLLLPFGNGVKFQ